MMRGLQLMRMKNYEATGVTLHLRNILRAWNHAAPPGVEIIAIPDDG